MLNYTNSKVKKIIEEEFQRELIITSIGNHELDRHLVYRIDGLYSCPVVFKMFGKENRVNREIVTLKLLSDCNVKTPVLISNGRFKGGIDWVITNLIEGTSLHEIYSELNNRKKEKILYDMGRELAQIHSYSTFDFFGNWDENGKSIEKNNDFKSVFKKRAEITITTLLKQKLPHNTIFDSAIRKLRDNYAILGNVHVSRLCHNDFDERNILVTERNQHYEISGVIDFEQALPWDIDYELAYIYYKLGEEGHEYLNAFMKGYRYFFDYSYTLNEKTRTYLLYKGLEICSWSYNVARDYYFKGLKMIKDSL